MHRPYPTGRGRSWRIGVDPRGDVPHFAEDRLPGAESCAQLVRKPLLHLAFLAGHVDVADLVPDRDRVAAVLDQVRGIGAWTTCECARVFDD